MSATGRGTERKPYDFYSTPIDCIENLLNNIDLSNYGNDVLEPSAGNGNICKVFKEYYPNKDLTAVELREEEYNNLCQLNIDDVIIDSFYNIRDKFNIIIGYHPYTEAQEFIEHSFELLKENGILIFLLRTNFLESKKRYEFWKKYPLTRLYTLSKRPSFTGKGTDATSYSWFIWEKCPNGQEIKII